MSLLNRLEKEFYPFVLKPGRYLGNEFNVVIKNPGEVNLRVALAFPELYELGMSHVGFEILYHILNQQADIWAERVYAPWPDAEEVLRQRQLPLFSLESKTPLSEFHLIGFTLQYELTFTNILNMLELGGIPIKAADRPKAFPLVIAGGPLATNPEPLADFMDGFLIGDGEEAVLEIAEVLKTARKENREKREILRQLAQIQGMYIPSFYRPVYSAAGIFEGLEKTEPSAPNRVTRRILPRLEGKNYPAKPLVPLIEVTHDRLSVEIMRGCTEGCRFCSAGMIYRPVRQRPVDDILHQTKLAIQHSGYDEISLLSLNSSDYDDLYWLMVKEKALVSEQKVKFSFPSLRLDGVTPEMVNFAATVKKSGFTFAPEAGSQRLRNIINKNIRDEDLLQTLEMVLAKGWQRIKFYFMIGLPQETEEDVRAIAQLMQRALDIARPYKNIQFTVSISPFSPKPHTPFQWEKQDHPSVLQKKTELLRSLLNSPQIKFSWRNAYLTSLETIIARGDRRIGEAIFRAWQLGARFDGWDEQFRWDLWEKAFQESGIAWEKQLEAISITLPLPWDHIDTGISKHFLKKEKFRAYEGQVSPDCKDRVCIGCGLQRKEFAELVDCYKQEKKGQTSPSNAFSPALSPGAVKDEGVAPETAPISYGRKARRRQVPVAPIKKKIRLRFTKLGMARYISHLDTIRAFDQAARRAKLQLVYSQGMTPRPRLSFGPPLGIGIASSAEYLDMEVELKQDVHIENTLNPFLPEGIKILQSRTIFTKAPALAAVINRQLYEVYDDAHSIEEQWIADWLSQSEVRVMRPTKAEEKEVDIRPYVTEIYKDGNKIIVQIDFIEGKTARITEVLETLLAPHGLDYREFYIERVGQFIVRENQIFTPFEIL